MDWLTRLDPEMVAAQLRGEKQELRRIECCVIDLTLEQAKAAIQAMEKQLEGRKIKMPTFECEECEGGIRVVGVMHPDHADLDIYAKGIMDSMVRGYAVYFKHYKARLEYDESQAKG